MPVPSVPSLGKRIRAQRLRRGSSVRALAREVGVSASMISQIENGKSRPSVSTLYAITNILGMSLQDVFEATEDLIGDASPAPTRMPPTRTPTAKAPPGGVPSTVLEALGSARGFRLGPLVQPEDRQVLNLDSGVTWERLGELPPLQVDFLLITYAPGGTSSSRGTVMRHPGWEYGYLLSGELVLTLGFEELQLGEGDAISFDSTTPHRYRNDRAEPAVGVWFVIENLP